MPNKQETKTTTKKITKKEEKKVIPTKESNPFEGKYLKTTGKRKTSTALVRLYENGKGIITINSQRVSQYFAQNLLTAINQPLKLTGHLKDVNFSIIVRGGGKKGQSIAVRHGITKALILLDKELRGKLKVKGWITRDPRKKERKKPGLRKARRAPQWSKR